MDSQREVGAEPLRATLAPLDTNSPGMPDAWERADGLDPTDAADRNVVASGHVYTNLDTSTAREGQHPFRSGTGIPAISVVGGVTVDGFTP